MSPKDLSTAYSDHYPQVLALARARLARESAPISTVTLAHDVFLQLEHRSDLRFDSREQFLGYVGRAMRSLLVDMARERLALRRAADLLPLTMGEDVADAGAARPEQVLALHEAIERLGQADARLLRIADMRAMLGMEVPEIAEALGISEPTVKRDWQRAKAFLAEALGT